MKFKFSNACSYSGPGGSKTCMSDETAEKIRNADFKNIPKEKLSALEKGKNIDELNLLLEHEVIDLLGEKVIEKEIKENFKPIGPAYSTDLFNNFVEDNVKYHYSRADSTFKPVHVQLIDFPESHYKYNNELRGFVENNIEDIKSGKLTTFGCVLNTLRSDGNLSKVGHWVAMFGDFRSEPYTIEYFNSGGTNAPSRVFKWMTKTAADIEKQTGKKTIPVNVSNIVHQKSDTECGAYSIFYIAKRLAGRSYKKFREVPLPDSTVTKFRQLALNDEKSIKNIDFLKGRMLV